MLLFWVTFSSYTSVAHLQYHRQLLPCTNELQYARTNDRLTWITIEHLWLADLIPLTSAEHFSVFQLIVLVFCPVNCFGWLSPLSFPDTTGGLLQQQSSLVTHRMLSWFGIVEHLAPEEPDYIINWWTPTRVHRAWLGTRDNVGWMCKWSTVCMKHHGLMVNIKVCVVFLNMLYSDSMTPQKSTYNWIDFQRELQPLNIVSLAKVVCIAWLLRYIALYISGVHVLPSTPPEPFDVNGLTPRDWWKKSVWIEHICRCEVQCSLNSEG